mgnify:CR=1 FL=1
MIELSQQQRQAYDKFIKARDKIKMVETSTNRKNEWVRFADVEGTVDVEGLNHPLYVRNDAWLDYKEAFNAWLAVEPEWRKAERMRASRGDYGTADSWEERGAKVSGVDSKFKE